MRFQISRLAFWLAAAALFVVTPAQAQQSQDVTNCVDRDRKFDPDVVIGGCTTVIRSGEYKGKNLAWALNNRGTVYHAKGENDLAIKDYTEAVRLNPEYTSGYYNRGNSLVRKKEYDRAIADYNKALSLTVPATVYAEGEAKRSNRIRADYFYGRGRAYNGKGDTKRAIADFKESVRLDPDHDQAKSELAALEKKS